MSHRERWQVYVLQKQEAHKYCVRAHLNMGGDFLARLHAVLRLRITDAAHQRLQGTEA